MRSILETPDEFLTTCPATVEKDHGRLVTRILKVAEARSNEFNFPHIKQYGILYSDTLELSSGEQRHEAHAIVTSLSKVRATPTQLLAYFRDEWCIENPIHHVRDVTYGEDHCRARTGNAARVLATFRNLAISMIHLAGGDETVAQTLRRGLINPAPLFDAFGFPRAENLSLAARRGQLLAA